MPNWVYCAFEVTGDPAELARFHQQVFRTVPSDQAFGSLKTEGMDTVFDFAAVIRPPQGTIGHPTRDWAIEHWGVKWNAIDLLLHGDPASGRIRFQFVTAWDFPTPVFDALSYLFPGLVFDGSAHEEGDAFAFAGQFGGADDWGPADLQWVDLDDLVGDGPAAGEA